MIILFIDHTAQNMKFSIRDFFSKCDQLRLRKLTEESSMENFIFCAESTNFI